MNSHTPVRGLAAVVPIVCLLWLAALGSGAAIASDPPDATEASPLLEDVLRMLDSGTSSSDVEAWLDTQDSPLGPLTAEDMLRLSRAGASEELMDEMLERSDPPRAEVIPPADRPYSRILSDKYNFRVGAQLSTFDTDIAAGSVLGALVQLEDVLGFEENIAAAGISGFYRFGPGRGGKHALRFGLVGLDREASGVATGTVPIFDVGFVGGFVSEFENRLLSLVYQYSFGNTGKMEAGFTAGLSVYQFGFFLAGAARVEGGPVASFQTERKEVIAPVPTVGFYINYAIRQNLIFGARADFTDLSVGEHEGRLLSTEVDWTWFFGKHLGVGLGLGSNELHYSKDSELDRLKVEYRQTNVSLFFSYVWRPRGP